MMKRTLFFLVMILSMITLSAQNDFPTRGANKKWNIGMMGGYMGYRGDYSSIALGFNFSYKGFYADLLGMSPLHEDDWGVSQWSDKTCFMAHTGYQIPITQKFRIIPIIGYASVSYGTTDGSNYHVSDSGIHNSFSVSSSASGFDYGGVAVLNINMININLAVTKFAIYAGVAIEL